LAVLFTLDVYVPLPLAIVLLFLLAAWGLESVQLTDLSLLPRLMILLYVMPFSVTLGYLGASDYTWWWTPTVLALLSDRVLIEQMMAIGITGLAALLAGLKAIEGSRVGERDLVDVAAEESSRRTLDAIAFVAALGLATALSWVYAPRTTIFEETYAAEGTEGLYQDLNFYGAYLASYILLVLLFVDAESSRPPARRWKRLGVLGTTLFTLIFLQLLRGDREIVGLLAALAILYVTEPMRNRAGRVGSRAWRRRMLGLTLPILVLVVVLIAVGAARFELSGGDVSTAGELLAVGFEHGTWTAVLLTNLAMAAQLQDGRIEYLYGETYGQYLLSLAPGIVTHYLGFERPIEAKNNPGYWFIGISSGGNHVVNVPFKNFGIFGVAGVLLLYGMAIGYWEKTGVRNGRWYRLVYGAITASSFMWFWYADMNVIRALMGAGVLWLGYCGWLAFTGAVVKDVRWADTAAPSEAGSSR
jgi:hypothetical protein